MKYANTALSTDVVAGRYRVMSTLGKGGMGTVFRVRDDVTGAELALKRLHSFDRGKLFEQMNQLFEAEYHTLLELAHPRVIEVFDYGVDRASPYYTMELLDGKDLSGAGRLPWRDVCRIMRDVASVLALLHSRGLIHRDISTRNIHVTPAGTAKLLDFGATMPMGTCKTMVGTAPCVPPEVLNQQELDGRVDLYALGAVTYWMLTRRHAYPARTIKQLPDMWRCQPSALSSLRPDLPEGLSRLVMSLLSPDRLARPNSPGEVMDKLAAIAGLEPTEELSVTHAYLTTPSMVGRDTTLITVRKALLQARRGSGHCLWLSGPTGVGRSRFLDACVLEGKLQGARVLRMDAADSTAGPWGGARALFEQLEDCAGTRARSVPGEAPLDVLRRTFGRDHPEMLEEVGELRLRPRLQQLLCDRLLAAAHEQVLLVAVDDIHRLDEPSVALLAALSQRVHGSHLLMAVTADSNAERAPEAACSLIADVARALELQALGPEDTTELLRSVFGDAPNVELVASRVHEVSRGIPRATMDLARYLVDRGIARYDAGAWLLPQRLQRGALPLEMHHVLEARFGALSDDARHLAQVLALVGNHKFIAEHYPTLGGLSAGAAKCAYDELTANHIVAESNASVFIHPAWLDAVTASLDPGHRRALHRHIARVAGELGLRYQPAQHLLYAGDDAEGLAELMPQVETALLAEPGPVTQVREGWYCELFRAARAACERVHAPRRWHCANEVMLYVGLCLNEQLEEARERLPRLLERLRSDSALTDYDALRAAPPHERLRLSLEAAQARYDGTDVHERVFSPLEAMRVLARVVTSTLSVGAGVYDYDIVSSLPSLQPLAPLSPALQVAEWMRLGSLQLLEGKKMRSVETFQKAAERAAHSDHAGLGKSVAELIQAACMFSTGLILASAGDRRALSMADAIENIPLHEVNAWRLRATYHLSEGDVARERECRKRAEQMQIEHAPVQHIERANTMSQLRAVGDTDDLLGVKRLLPFMREQAKRFFGYRALLHFTEGEYARLRGDLPQALGHYQCALEAGPLAKHVVWASSAERYVGMLVELGRCREALEVGSAWLEVAERLEITHNLDLPLALCKAKLGDHGGAMAMAERAVAHRSRQLGSMLGRAHDVRARVAIEMGDQEAFEVHAQLCAEQYKHGRGCALAAKHERLLEAARARGLRVSPEVEHDAEELAELSSQQTGLQQVDNEWPAPATARLRAEQALRLLLERLDASEGHLYVMQPDRLALAASSGASCPEGLAHAAQQYLEAEDAQDADTCFDDLFTAPHRETHDNVWLSADGRKYALVLIHHFDQDTMVMSAVAAVALRGIERFDLPWPFVRALSLSLGQPDDIPPLAAPVSTHAE